MFAITIARKTRRKGFTPRSVSGEMQGTKLANRRAVQTLGLPWSSGVCYAWRACPTIKSRCAQAITVGLEPLAVRLLGLALDSGVPEHVALSAVNSVMDRVA